MVEKERRYEVDDSFGMPDLTATGPAGGRVRAVPPVTLTATYFDTADLRLARAGVSVRHRRGDDPPWTVELPTGSPGTRHEITRPGRARAVPRELTGLVTAFTRGARLAPVVTVRTERHGYELRDADDVLLAEVVDDRGAVLDRAGRAGAPFRELEVERRAGDRELLDRVERVLRDAGARVGTFTPEHIRALGAAARGEPDLVAPTGLPADPCAGDVVTEALRRHVRRLLTHDPLVRLRMPPGDDRSAVQQMRVGCRRLRSDLRTFAPLVRPTWAGPLGAELAWLAGVLGAARDVEVLRARLRRTADADPACPVDRAAVDRLDAALAARQERALAAVDEALRSRRYLALVDALVLATRAPRLAPRAGASAAKAMPRLVARPWRKLTGGKTGAAALDPVGPDEPWHAVRKRSKQARYAMQAVAPVVGGDATELARALARVQGLLGEHQDAAVAADTWAAIAGERPDDHRLAVTAGRLLERERAVVRRARADYPDAWRQATIRRRTKWLR